MLRVWVGERPAGLLDRHKNRGSAFTYADPSDDVDAISLTMPKRLASWTVDYGLAPIFDMNLPEGALRALLTAKFARAAGSFDDLDLLTVVGRTQIGRLRYSGANEDLAAEAPFQSVDEILKARRGGGLFEHLMQTFAAYSGVSGVQPKVLIRGDDDQGDWRHHKLRGATHIVKFWERDGEYQELAANEFFCMSAAKRIGIPTPEFQLSEDGGALVVERFDRKEDGGYLGFEDFTVLNGVTAARKYEGGYETKLFRRAADFITGERRGQALRYLFRLFVLNCAVRNGDAHLKNFGVVYDDTRSDARPAPAYDIVTTSAYLPKDQMALTLNGVPTWPDAKKLTHLGQTRAGLTGPQVKQIFEETADALAAIASEAHAYFKDRNPEIGERMMAAWRDGVASSLGLAQHPFVTLNIAAVTAAPHPSP